ncbi:hypothetical protein [Ferribacterium limneticum]|uniref:hypothetical protein n=1 Tax=Ferribacterium limneticum TaxID=76259 RepID=UPI001CF8B295|nr:hypothetical protein [Ferribacterium limneticum]UCV26756.1 hypothetical protein KI617_10585 [Ferribacterium limneticum]UCV30673.1 hypothetical protein KI608_10585 [Ferribacterium limneticum]
MIESIHDQCAVSIGLRAVTFQAGRRKVEVVEFDSNLTQVRIYSPNWPEPQVVNLTPVALYLLRESLLELDDIVYGQHLGFSMNPEAHEDGFMVPEEQL